MISLMGFLLYGVVLFSAYKFETIRTMLEQALLLAPELSTGMFILYFYPLILNFFLKIAKKNSSQHALLLKKQTNVSASVAVSFGLIGTFQGLTAMVSSIAASMGGDGDMAERMGAMLSAISEALGAMSYAFLTSILGVGVSVLLILSLNFWMFGFKSEESSAKEKTAPDVDSLKNIVDQLVMLTNLHQQSSEKIVNLVTNEEKTELLIDSLKEINHHNTFLYNNFLEAKERSKIFQIELFEKINLTENNNIKIQKALNEKSISVLKQIKSEMEPLKEINNYNKLFYNEFLETRERNENFQNELFNKVSSIEGNNTKLQNTLNEKSINELNQIKNEVKLSKEINIEQNEKLSLIINETQSKFEKMKNMFKDL